jgi:hypothetical protein
MAPIIRSTLGGNCGICFEEFVLADQGLTHKGGEGHPGFHSECLKNWLHLNSICPFDRTPIDANSLISRTDKIMAKLRPALTDAVYGACAASFATLAGAAVVAAGGVDLATRAISSYSIGLGAMAGGLVAGAVKHVALPLIGIALVSDVQFGESLLVGLAAGTVIGAGIKSILNRRQVSEITRKNIALGIAIGGLVSSYINIHFLPLAAINSMVAGVGAGMISLADRHFS